MIGYKKQWGWLIFIITLILLIGVLAVGRLQADSSDWRLTEVMANAEDEKKGEFFELQYLGTGVDISGWSIADNQDTDGLLSWSKNGVVGKDSTDIVSGDLLIILDSDFVDEYENWWQNEEVDLSKVVVVTIDDADIGNGLNNNGEEIKIYDDQKNEVGSFNWSTNTKNGKSLEWVGDGWVESDLESGNSLGWIREKTNEEVSDDKQTDLEEVEKWQRFWNEGQVPVRINELMINPVGEDDEEWIELASIFDQEVDLAGWYICDSKCTLESKEGGYKITDGKLLAKGYLVLKKQETGINLNNSGDKLILYDPNHDWVDAVEYDIGVKEGSVFAWNEGNWLINDLSSPGAKNIWLESEKDNLTLSEDVIDQSNDDKYLNVDSIESVKKMNDGIKVKLAGVVLVDYDLISENSLWIGDNGGGIMLKGEVLTGQKKDTKIIAYGETDGLKYQKIVRVTKVEIDGLEDLPVKNIKIDELASYQDQLVTLVGKISQKTTVNSFCLQDESGEVKILVKDVIEIDKEVVKIANQLQISGIVVLTADGYKLYPTQKNDLTLTKSGKLPQVGPGWLRLVTSWR